MKFEINNRHWEIREVEEQTIINEIQKWEKNKVVMGNGYTDFQKLRIFLNEDLPYDQKRQTLMHELMHCYIRSFIFLPQFDEASEETICDISANSHDIIHKIVEDYFIDKK